jgi:ATP-dependent DNA ligase
MHPPAGNEAQRACPQRRARCEQAPFAIDGEGVILQAGGVSDFDRLHARRHDDVVQLLGFDEILRNV